MDEERRGRLGEAKRVITRIREALGHESRVSVLIVGHDLSYMVSVHQGFLPDGEATLDTEWRQRETKRFDLEGVGTNVFAIAAAARVHWPDVEVYDCHCTCCTDGLTVVSENDIARYTESAA